VVGGDDRGLGVGEVLSKPKRADSNFDTAIVDSNVVKQGNNKTG